MSPGGAVLLADMIVRIRDLGREQQTIVFHTAGLPQFLKLFRAEHLPERIRGVDRTINKDMDNVDALGCELRVETLAKHPPSSHCRRM